MFDALLEGGVQVGGSVGGCPSDPFTWFWFELERWPDPEVTNGPRLGSRDASAAYRALWEARRGEGPIRRSLVDVWVRERTVLGATLAASSGDPDTDALALALYHGAPRTLDGAEAFRVTVYARDPVPGGSAQGP